MQIVPEFPESACQNFRNPQAQAKVAAETSHKILGEAKSTSQTSSFILEQVNRSFDPITKLTQGSISVDIMGPIVTSYAARVREREFLAILGLRPIYAGEPDYPNPSLDDEAELSSLLKHFDDVSIVFEEPDELVALEIRIHCKGSVEEEERRSLTTRHYSTGAEVSYTCGGVVAEVGSAGSKYKSIRDLDGLRVKLYGREWTVPSIERLSIHVGQANGNGIEVIATDFKPFHRHWSFKAADDIGDDLYGLFALVQVK
jgi:hypothetical protein